MKTIKRDELQSEYAKIALSGFFAEKYEVHGTLVECNFGGLCITIDDGGESCIIVRDWGDDTLQICKEPIEIRYDESDIPFFVLDDQQYGLDEFIRTK